MRIFSLLLLALVLSCAANDSQGKLLYESQCANCHMNDGRGLAAIIPPIADSDFLQKNFDLLPCIIRNGVSDTILVNGTPYSEPMKGFDYLKEEEIINIINYINDNWSYDQKFLTPVKYQDQITLCGDK